MYKEKHRWTSKKWGWYGVLAMQPAMKPAKHRTSHAMYDYVYLDRLPELPKALSSTGWDKLYMNEV